MNATLIKLMGWKANVLNGDPSLYDQWKWVRRHLQPGPYRTLEVDCGTGCFSLYAATLGNEVFGLDPDAASIRSAESQARLLGARTTQFLRSDSGTLLELARKKGFNAFDQILCLDATDHLETQLSWVSRLSELLKPGGKLLMTADYKYTKPLYGEAPPPAQDASKDLEKLRGFTHEEIGRRFKEAGMHVIEQDYLSGLVTQTLNSATRAVSKANSTVAWSLVLPLRLLQVMDSPVTRFTRHPHLQLAVVGVKPRPKTTEPATH